MFCSTIIPTIGRTTLSRAVNSVLDQEFGQDDHEIIVVNDSGKPLPQQAWQKSEKVRIIHTNRHNRSVARNAGAAVALGDYLHFLDDDDWMLPGAFRSFRELYGSGKAAWIYGAFRMVDNDDNLVADIYPNLAGNVLMQVIAWEWLPLQASIIESNAFFAVGGFASLHSLLGGFEDIDLSRRIACHYDMAYVPRVVTCIRIGDEGSTTDYVNMYRQNRQSRENTLDSPGVFSRMSASALASQTDSSYWFGKIVYYHLASIRWHLRHGRLFSAISRSIYALAGLLAAGMRPLSAEFWTGVLKPHYPQMGTALQESNAEHLYSATRAKIVE